MRPVEAEDARADAVNRAIPDRFGGPEKIDYLALRCGTAVRAKEAILRGFHDGDAAPDDPATTSWLQYLTAHSGRA